MTDVTVIDAPATLRDAYFATRPTRSFNDILDRRERLAAMQQHVDTAFNAIGTTEGWSAFIDGLARFPQLTPANIILTLDQDPAATRLNTHRGWVALERTPLQRGIALLLPSLRHKRVQGKAVWDGGYPVMEEVRQRPTTVFDYAATAGTYIPRTWEKRQDRPLEGFVDDMRAAAATIGYSVEARRDEAPAERRVLSLIHGQDERTTALRLARQLGAVTCGEGGADLFAYALCMANGMEVEAPRLPADPVQAIGAASSGLRRIQQRTRFRNQV